MTQYDLKAESQRLLELTAEQHRVKTLTDRARGRLSAAILDLHTTTGVVGKFKHRGAGEVRLDGIDGEPKPYVANADTYASYVAERSPDNVQATIEVPAKLLEDALAALELANIEHLSAKVAVRDAFIIKHMADIELEVNPEHEAKPSTEPKWLAFDVTAGEQVPGLAGKQATPVLKVVLDKEHKIEIEDDAAREDETAARDLGYGIDDDAAQDDVEIDEMAAKAASPLTRGQVLAVHAMKGGGFTTPEREEERYQADVAKGNAPPDLTPEETAAWLRGELDDLRHSEEGAEAPEGGE